MKTHTTLVAALGEKPQVITFLLDLLLAQGETIEQVIVIYLARSQAAFEHLACEFKGGQYQGRSCQFRGVPIRLGRSNLDDIRAPDEVDAVRQSIHALLGELKDQGQRIHFGLSGGRRVISLVALAAAMQYLTPADRLWHIYTPAVLVKKAGDGAILHVPAGAGVRLIPVPFVPWVAYFPGLAGLLKRSPQEIGEAALGWLDEPERGRCRRVWDELTPRQKAVLREFAQGLSNKQVALKLRIKKGTVYDHKRAIMAQCVLVWETQDGKEFNENFLQQRFGPFLAGLRQA